MASWRRIVWLMTTRQLISMAYKILFIPIWFCAFSLPVMQYEVPPHVLGPLFVVVLCTVAILPNIIGNWFSNNSSTNEPINIMLLIGVVGDVVALFRSWIFAAVCVQLVVSRLSKYFTTSSCEPVVYYRCLVSLERYPFKTLIFFVHRQVLHRVRVMFSRWMWYRLCPSPQLWRRATEWTSCVLLWRLQSIVCDLQR